MATVLNFSKLKITATEPQPYRTVLEYFAIFNNVAHSLEPRVHKETENGDQAQDQIDKLP